MRNDFLYNMDGVPLSVNVVGYTCQTHRWQCGVMSFLDGIYGNSPNLEYRKNEEIHKI